MEKAVSIPDELREELMCFAKAYNYFEKGDCIKVMQNWVDNDNVASIYYYLKPHPEDELLHLTYTSLSQMDLNEVIVFYQNAKKKVELLKKKEELFEKIAKIRGIS